MMNLLCFFLVNTLLTSAQVSVQQPLWISGGVNASLPTAVCGTCNGCTGNKLFLACDSPKASITNITFAAYGGRARTYAAHMHAHHDLPCTR